MKKTMMKSAMQYEENSHVHQRVREGLFIIFIFLALYILVALMTHNANDPGWSQTGLSNEIANLTGKTGAWFSDVLFSLFGYLAYFLPPTVVFIGILLYQPKTEAKLLSLEAKSSVWCIRSAGLILVLLTSCGLASMGALISSLPMTSGGLLGLVVRTALVQQLNYVGATIVLVAFFLASITLLTGVSWLSLTDLVGHYSWRAMRYIHQLSPHIWAKIGRLCVNVQHNLQQAYYKITALCAHVRIRRKTKAQINSTEINHTDVSICKMDATYPVIYPPCEENSEENIGHDDKDIFEDIHAFQAAMRRQPQIHRAETAPLGQVSFAKTPVLKENPFKEFMAKEAHVNVSVNNEEKESLLKASIFKNITKTIAVEHKKLNIAASPPSLTLLDASEVRDAPVGFNKTELEHLSQLVERRLTEFGVQAKVIGVHPGPVVTRFELDLAAGIKVSKISGLSKDLARSLSVMSVRVVEVIPGKSYIGIEIPNERREMVRLKDILVSTGYQIADSPLTLGLGKDISGRPVSVDLAKMPHLLVAGTTGSGKSVGINAMILSILYKATPETVRMILIDPKMLELSVYDKIPHLLTPVVTDMKDAASALRWCIGEMESRYQLMAALGVRNLAGYNQKVLEAMQAGEPLFDPLWEPNLGLEPEMLSKKPYIVVVVDEFADMIMVVGKQVEELIARIAQKARAAGIHLILATQRPSVDVITGLIKANIPSRIAFQVSCRIDSRTILDQAGAEQLLGHGDMLYLAPGGGIPQRIHGAFVSDEEVHKVANQWRKQGTPDYIESILKHSASIPGLDTPRGGDEYDELYDEAVKIVTETRRPSISHVQRRLRIGYNRAACLIEQMERDGVVSAMQSNGTREVLAPPPVER